jgi:hypothetical protein
MPRTARFAERVGKVFLPEADVLDPGEDFTPDPEGPVPGPGFPIPFPGERLPRPQLIEPFPRLRFCRTTLRAGCYTLSLVPNSISVFGTRYQGTLRVESVASGLRISGDLYRYRLLDEFVLERPVRTIAAFEPVRGAVLTAEAADTGGTIPIYRRNRYHSYLKGTGAQLLRVVEVGTPCPFTLSFDEFVYNHPATGFSGTFNATRTRGLRFELRRTATPDLYSGEAYDGTTFVGAVSIRWVSASFRRAHLQIHTLQGAETPPAVGTTTFATIFAGAGWDVTVNDGGSIALPAALAGVNINACWSRANLHTLMSSVPGYNPADLDTVWRVHLVSVPATLGCSRGVMFDSSTGADPNGIPREGSAAFSRDGYPATDCPDGMGGSHYDAVAGQQQRNVPRAFLRSATHEVGHAFNQIHQEFELGIDNSIMTPTPSVATVIGTGGNFPNDINLAFNNTVIRHLRHLPDPAVRPGAMDFFGSAIAAPEAADVSWLDAAALSIALSSDSVSLGEPVALTFELANRGEVALPVPSELDVESLTVRVSVTDPAGRITFMRPATIESCPRTGLIELPPRKSIKGATTLFWGRDGFAFETPGRHVVEVIVLWNVVGATLGACAERDLYVDYPVTRADNEVAALLLDPEVGRAVASGNVYAFERAAARIRKVLTSARSHPAAKALRNLELALDRPRRAARATGRRRAAKTSRRRA